MTQSGMNPIIQPIIAALKEGTQLDKFCTQLSNPCNDLELRVDPIGLIEFPITAKTAKSLIVEAEPAKYGKGTETLLDRKVRDVWEIPGNRIQVSETWMEQLSSILKKIQKNLSLPEEGELIASIHNLVIYMPGQFFKGHQDTEKSSGMIATLVVLLPSEFSGGSHIIDQHGDKKMFLAPEHLSTKLSLIAFYADCHHEVKPVIEGYRIALTYNLVFKPSFKNLSFISNEDLNVKVESYFNEVDIGLSSYRESHPKWLVYLLDHEYTQYSLNWTTLRGADRSSVAQLLGSAEKLNLQAHLTLVDIHETWSAESEDAYGRYGKWRNRRYSNWKEEDREDDDGSPSEEYELIELIDDDIELRHWVNANGQVLERKNHFIPKEMMCWTKAVDAFKPFRSEYEGYTGNAGETLDRWYHRAALVLWKKDLELSHLFVIDSTEALNKVAKLLRENLDDGLSALEQLLSRWPKGASFLDSALVFEIAGLVRSPKTASQLVENLGLKALSSRSKESFLSLIESYGEGWCLNLLTTWGTLEGFERNFLSEDLIPLAESFAKRSKKMSSWILEHRFAQITREDQRNALLSPYSLKSFFEKRFTEITNLLNAAAKSNHPEIYKKVLSHLLVNSYLYHPTEVVALILPKLILPPKEFGVEPFLTELSQELTKIASLKRKKDDWSIQVQTRCDCENCKELKEFLKSSTEQSFTWKMAKELRRHVENVVSELLIPVACQTRSVGSPHQLILTKTEELFSIDEKKAKLAKEGLVAIETIRKKLIL